MLLRSAVKRVVDSVLLGTLLRTSWTAEDLRHLGEFDDTEGLPLDYPKSPLLFACPTSPLTDYEMSDSDVEALRLWPPVAAVISSGPSAAKKRRAPGRKEYKKELRRQKRQAKAQAPNPSLLPSKARQRRQATLKETAKFNADSLPVSGPGFIGVRREQTSTTNHRLEELAANGFRLIEWDGLSTILIVDCEDRVLAILVGRPGGTDWDIVMKEAEQALQKFREEGLKGQCFVYDDLHHRRGSFLASACGISFGGGQMRPGNISHSKRLRELWDGLLSLTCIQRIAGYQNAAYHDFCHRMHQKMVATMNALISWCPDLRMNFPSYSAYPMITVNCGPSTEALEHVDHGNSVETFCNIFATGSYDHTQGGHEILYNLKLVVQFPPGSSILLPSATISHGNTPIGEHETRYSITQYCPGGLMRWVHYGFTSLKSLKESATGRATIMRLDGLSGSRFAQTLDIFPKVSEITVR